MKILYITWKLIFQSVKKVCILYLFELLILGLYRKVLNTIQNDSRDINLVKRGN